MTTWIQCADGTSKPRIEDQSLGGVVGVPDWSRGASWVQERMGREAGKRGASFKESYWAKENRVVVGREVGWREVMCRV